MFTYYFLIHPFRLVPIISGSTPKTLDQQLYITGYELSHHDILHGLYKQCHNKIPDIFYFAHMFCLTNYGHNSWAYNNLTSPSRVLPLSATWGRAQQLCGFDPWGRAEQLCGFDP